jgi:hypothetical protein
MENKTEQYIEKLKELLQKSNEISTFYGKVIDSNAMFLHAHGIKASDEEVKRGHRLRDEFNKLKSEAMSLEQEVFGESVLDDTK